MVPASYPHLAEIAEILAGAIVRIKAEKTEENQNSEAGCDFTLDFSQNLSVTVDRLVRPE